MSKKVIRSARRVRSTITTPAPVAKTANCHTVADRIAKAYRLAQVVDEIVKQQPLTAETPTEGLAEIMRQIVDHLCWVDRLPDGVLASLPAPDTDEEWDIADGQDVHLLLAASSGVPSYLPNARARALTGITLHSEEAI